MFSLSSTATQSYGTDIPVQNLPAFLTSGHTQEAFHSYGIGPQTDEAACRGADVPGGSESPTPASVLRDEWTKISAFCDPSPEAPGGDSDLNYSLNQYFPTLARCQNHLKSFKKYLCPGHTTL